MSDPHDDDAVLDRFADALARAGAEPALEAPPVDLVERAAAIAGELPPPAGARPSVWSLGRLVRSALAPSLAGVRGAAPGRRLYASDAGRVDVEVGEDPEDAERWRVVGQLEPAGEARAGGGGDGGEAGGLAILWAGAAVIAHSALDAAGMFAMGGVADGSYRLEVWSPAPAAMVRIDPFDLPPADDAAGAESP